MSVRHARPRSRAILAVSSAALLLSAIAHAPSANAATRTVTNCNNSGSGSLRSAAALAVSGDTIDLRGLACTRITLTSDIVLPQANLTVLGRDRFALTLHGNRTNRIFRHTGTGTLRISRLTLAYGRFASGNGFGGCLYSDGSVELLRSRVHHCEAWGQGGLEPIAGGGGVMAWGDVLLAYTSVFENRAESGDAFGGGVATQARLTLFRSQVYNNQAGYGGGAWADDSVSATYSIVQNNSAFHDGGGINARENLLLNKTTVSGNYASWDGGGVYVLGDGVARVVDSTISGNRASNESAAAFIRVQTEITNSTIAFNHEEPFPGDGCWGTVSVGTLRLQSSIVAGNTCSESPAWDINGFIDLGANVTGADNLVGSSNLPLPADTLSANPRLAPLAWNGGPTRTHALLSDSPAIDRGNNVRNRLYDQRGPGFPRVRGAGPDIGAFER